ncbi:hypothetical protein [Streptomyces sp. NPDC006368]|uniref:hypothetical protein n=1 Tax=Streptomyces sp. NPDC006368 TaxID=3156760 RepID=UPI0033A1E78D
MKSAEPLEHRLPGTGDGGGRVDEQTFARLVDRSIAQCRTGGPVQAGFGAGGLGDPAQPGVACLSGGDELDVHGPPPFTGPAVVLMAMAQVFRQKGAGNGQRPTADRRDERPPVHVSPPRGDHDVRSGIHA